MSLRMPNNKHQLHVSTGRWQLGLCLSFIAAFFWGILPIILKTLLDKVDVYTLGCSRFLVAGIMLFILAAGRKRLPAMSKLRGPVLALLAVAIIMLGGNYVLYLAGLIQLSPSVATVVIQLGPIFMLLGGLIVFKENFSPRQWLGFGILIFGLALFFNDRLAMLLSSLNNYTVGVLLIVLAGLFWAIYTMAQKQLLRTFASETIVLIVFCVGGLLLLPFADLTQVIQLKLVPFLLLILCGFNTFAAYRCLAEALNHWEASRISMVLAITPLITIVSTKCCAVMFPDYVRVEQLNILSILGALLVVAGSVLCAFSRAKNAKVPQARRAQCGYNS